MALPDFNTSDAMYQAGGYSADNAWKQDSASNPDSFAGMVGRFWNNLSGATASNMAQMQENERNRVYNSAEAEKQRQHELYMSNTAYQRAAEDMKAAGINPAMLSGIASGGSVASSSSSSAASFGGSGGYAHGKSGSGVIGSLIRSLVLLAVAK